MKQTFLFLGPIIVLVLLAGAAWAQVSPNASAPLSASHDLSWHVLAAGGAPLASAGHRVDGTLGQLAIGRVGGTGHTLYSGYWHPSPVAGGSFDIFLPVVVKNS